MLSSICYVSLGLLSVHALPQANMQICIQHKVVENDTGYNLALQYKVDFDTQVAPNNPSVDWNNLQVGSNLKICGIPLFSPPTSNDKPVTVVPPVSPPVSTDKPATSSKSLFMPDLCAEAADSNEMNPITRLYSCKTCSKDTSGNPYTLVTDPNNDNFKFCVKSGFDFQQNINRPIFALINGVYNCLYMDQSGVANIPEKVLKYQTCSTLTITDGQSGFTDSPQNHNFKSNGHYLTGENGEITDGGMVVSSYYPNVPPKNGELSFSDHQMVFGSDYCVSAGNDNHLIFTKKVACLRMGFLTV